MRCEWDIDSGQCEAGVATAHPSSDRCAAHFVRGISRRRHKGRSGFLTASIEDNLLISRSGKDSASPLPRRPFLISTLNPHNRKSQIDQSKIKPSVFSVVIHYPLPTTHCFPREAERIPLPLCLAPLKRNSSFVILHSSLFTLPTTTCQRKWGSHSVRTPLKTQIEISTCCYRLLWQVRLITSSCCSRVRSMNFTA